MFGINKVMLVGNLGADPEVRKTSNQQTFSQFSLATSESWVNREGERQEKTEWHRIVVWGKLAETCAKHLSKGRQVFIEGRLQTRSWETEQGGKRFTTEIVATQVLFLGGKGSHSFEREESATSSQTGTSSHFQKEPAFQSNNSSSAGGGTKEEDLPF